MAGAQFSKGDEVEVTIPEEGFRGSWFSATVIRPVAKKNKMYVQYHSLLEEEGKATKLKEYVNPFNVRPLPPREPNRIFKLHDEVDAFYDDGWWEGDITRVVEEEGSEKFVVYFRASKEEMTFRPSELRIHREWISGSWDPPIADEHQGVSSNPKADQNKEPSKLVIKLSKGIPSKSGANQTNESSKFVVDLTKGTQSKSGADQTNELSKFVVDLTKGTRSKSEADQDNESFKSGADKTKKSPKLVVKFGKGGMSSKFRTDQNKEASESVVKFDKGTPVEISSDEKGFEGAWFVGTVVETVGENKFLVEHKNLKTDDLTEFLKEEVDSLHIRPAPPEILKDHYKKLEEVDALHNDAWWVGLISKVDNGAQAGYYVYFKNTGEELKYKHHELRPHQEWIRGEWIRPSEAF